MHRKIVYITYLRNAMECFPAMELTQLASCQIRKNCGLRMLRECRERFPHYRGLAIPACIMARAWRTCRCSSWWRHQMETFSALLAICAGNSSVPGEFPAHRPVTRSFDVFFELRLNKQLSKQSWGWWFETLLCPIWRHSNIYWYDTIAPAPTKQPGKHVDK